VEVVGSEVNADVVTGTEAVGNEVGVAIEEDIATEEDIAIEEDVTTAVLAPLVEALDATDNAGTQLLVVVPTACGGCGGATGAGLFPVFPDRSGIDCRSARP
jgi:hypothetical protein